MAQSTVQLAIQVLKDLVHEEIIQLCKAGQLVKVNTNALLLKPGDMDDALFLFLSGAIASIRKDGDHIIETMMLEPGDWFGGTGYVNSEGQNNTIIRAMRPSTVLRFEQGIIRELKPTTQLFIAKRAQKVLAKRMDHVGRRVNDLGERNRWLTTYIRGANYEYTSVEVIRNLIQSIPRLPIYATKILTLLKNEEASAKDVVHLIKDDPSLVAEVMKVVNSAFYGFPQKITDFKHAVMLLGFNEIYQIIISGGIRRVMPKTPEFEALHNRCVSVANIIYELAEHLHHARPAMVSTIGLLHNSGDTLILLLKQKNPKLRMFFDMLDEARMGATLLKVWELPDEVWQSVDLQSYPHFTDPKDIPEEYREFVASVYVGKLLYQLLAEESIDRMDTLYLDRYFKVLKLKVHTVEDLLDQIVMPRLVKRAKYFNDHLRRLINRKLAKAESE